MKRGPYLRKRRVLEWCALHLAKDPIDDDVNSCYDAPTLTVEGGDDGHSDEGTRRLPGNGLRHD